MMGAKSYSRSKTSSRPSTMPLYFRQRTTFSRPYAVGVTSTPLPPRRRILALVIADIVASVVIVALALLLGLVVLGFVAQFAGFTADCGPGTYPGLQCNATVLGIATYGLLTVTVVSFFVGLGMAIVRVIQKRAAFVWPLGAFIVMIAAFYLAAWAAGQTVPT